MNNIATYLLLRRDCYYVGTQQMLRRDVISGASVSGDAYTQPTFFNEKAPKCSIKYILVQK